MSVRFVMSARKIDLPRATKKFHDKVETFWYGAIGAFIQGVASVVAINQDTGMSLASLFPSARKARVLGKMPALSIKHAHVKRPSSFAGYRSDTYHYRNQFIGEKLGEKALHVTTGGRTFKFRFTFEIEVFQYMLNELGLGTLPAIESIAAGQSAMDTYIAYHSHFILPNFYDVFTESGEVEIS